MSTPGTMAAWRARVAEKHPELRGYALIRSDELARVVQELGTDAGWEILKRITRENAENTPTGDAAP